MDLVSLSANLGLIDEMYEAYRRDPSAVDASWRELFKNGAPARASGPSIAPVPAPVAPAVPVIGGNGNGSKGPAAVLSASLAATQQRRPSGTQQPALEIGEASTRTRIARTTEALGSGGAFPLVHAYRAYGHLAADLDPLGLMRPQEPPELAGQIAGVMADDPRLAELVGRLRHAYCRTIGLEFMHISSPDQRAWLAERMERQADQPKPKPEIRKSMLDKLIAAESFERFVHTKFPGTKRFSLEGGESMIPLLEEILDQAGRHGAIEAVLGMAHRGRLNVLVQTLKRAPRDIFSEFQDIEPEATLGGGDVKYHLGYSCDRVDRDGNAMHVSLTFNPSHLEAVDPVVVGRVRAKQRRHGDWERRRIVGVLIHGDAAFAGQGLVPETLQLSNLHGYRTGGTVHLIVNNQIGFTAAPHEQRSTTYCTDVAKMIECPIWHVNGEDLDAVFRVVEMAMEYRARFQNDVIIDMYCYRKFGHNEMDEPGFTQPVMYRRIQQKQPIDALYGATLVEEGVLGAADVAAMRESWRLAYEKELEASRSSAKRPVIPALGGMWSGYRGGPAREVPDVDTGVEAARLQEIGVACSTAPEGFNAHPKIRRLLEQRAQMARGEKEIDWGMAEMLAYGSLLWDGRMVRLSGQDSSRGTFSHRHAIITDVDSGREHMLLGQLHSEQGECRIYDSPLSEAAVMGFEFGYSLDYPDGLVIWEAQFGDFVNGAQVIVDQFIMSSEDKWKRLSGLVLFLPHGYEGQGPEHSSARIERFCESAAEDNVQLVQPSTPAQVFHVLRRQVLRTYRKPLIVFTPKSLLRLPAATSTIDAFTTGTFQRLIGDPVVAPDKVERVFFCSGRIYYDLVEERKTRKDERTAIIRVEQLYPWYPELVRKTVAPFTRAKKYVWVQDEPVNMGPQSFLMPRLAEVFGWDKVAAVSRPEGASPATGSHKAHGLEQRTLLDQAFATE
jgi:2-oxoglutarate dehydrogenase E1 component